MRRIPTFFIIIQLWACFACIDALGKPSLELLISFDKKEYSKSDQIKVRFTLTNKSEEPIYVNRRFFINTEEADKKHREITLSVESPSADLLPCKINHETGLPKTDYFVLLKTGEQAATDREKTINHYFDFSQPGVYKITAKYKNAHGKELGLNAYTGEVVSKPVKITIE